MSHLQPHQARTAEPTPYELKLAGAIEEIFGSGQHELAGVVDRLNERSVPAPDGKPWTPDSFTEELHRLATNSAGA